MLNSSERLTCRCIKCEPFNKVRSKDLNLFTRAEIYGITRVMRARLRANYKNTYGLATGLQLRMACPLIKAFEEIEESLWVD